jgi:hypothetical protein
MIILSMICNASLNLNNHSKISPEGKNKPPVKPLSYFADRYKSRDEGMVQAYLSGHYTLAQVGEHFGESYATVSRAVKQAEKSKR